MTRRGLDTKTFGVLSTPTVGDFLNPHGGSQKENPLQLAGCLRSTGASFLPAFSFSSRGCLCDGWNLLPDLWSLRLDQGLPLSAALSHFPQQSLNSPWRSGALRPVGGFKAPCLSVRGCCGRSGFQLALFGGNCSGKRPGRDLSAHWSFGELLGQTQAPPCSRLCPQGCDSLTKQLGSVVTPSQLGEKKSLQRTPTQPLCFPSSRAPAFRKEETDTVFHLPTRPEGSSSGRRLALGMFSWKFCQLKGCCASPSSQEEAGEISTP